MKLEPTGRYPSKRCRSDVSSKSVGTEKLELSKRAQLSVACLTSQQHDSVSQGRICSDSCTCCHTEIKVADQTFYLAQSQYTYAGRTSASAGPITRGAWQGSHWNTNFEVNGMTRCGKDQRWKRDWTQSAALEADALPQGQCGSQTRTDLGPVSWRPTTVK